MRIDVHHHFPPGSGSADLKLDSIIALVKALGVQLRVQGETMSQALDTLTQKVAETTTVEDSAIQLLTGLSAQIAALKTDPVALQALADSLSSKSAELAAAVIANTPTP